MILNDDDYYLCDTITKKVLKHYGSFMCFPVGENQIVLTGMQLKCRGYHV